MRGVPASSQSLGLGELRSLLLEGQRTRTDLDWMQALSQSLLFPRAMQTSEVTVHLVAVLGGGGGQGEES